MSKIITNGFKKQLAPFDVQNDAPTEMKNSWYNSIDEHRERIKDALAAIPSLQNYLPEAINKSYSGARKLAIKEGKRASYGFRQPTENEYPQQCPFSIEQLLDEDFYGEFNPEELS